MKKYSIAASDIPIMMLLINMIIPYYFRIGPVQGTNLIYLVVLVTAALVFRKKISINKHTFIIALWMCVRIMINIYHREYMFAVTYLIKMVAIWYTVSCFTLNKSGIKELIDKVIDISLITGIFGIIEAVTHKNFFSLLNNSGAYLNYNEARLGMVRIISFTSQTIHYAVFCAVIIFLIIFRLSYTEKNNDKIKFLFVAGIQFANLILTLSRSVIICFFICVFLMLLMTEIKQSFKYIVIIIVAFLALSLFSDTSIISQIVYMVLTPIFNSFGNKLAENWGTEDINGIGDRMRLYLWVYSSMKDNLLLGFGETKQFAYIYTIYEIWGSYNVTKTSIEVNYLSLLYHYGVVGTVSELFMYGYFLIYSIRRKIKDTLYQNEKITFSWILFIILLLELMSWVAVMAGEEINIIYLLLFAWSSYMVMRKSCNK